MNTVPRHLSLVPACPYTLAISLAVAEVEKRQQDRAARRTPLCQRIHASLLRDAHH